LADPVADRGVSARQRGEHNRGGQDDESTHENGARNADPARCGALNRDRGCKAGHGSILLLTRITHINREADM
jgi:hypothetical protein